MCKNFDLKNDIHALSSSHTLACVKKDDIVGLITKELQNSQVFVEKADRAHHVLRNVKPCFTVDDPDKSSGLTSTKRNFLSTTFLSDSDAIYYV